MCDTPPDSHAVHCRICKVEPGQNCRSPNGDPRRVDHSERIHLAYALVHPESGFNRGEAERYRKQYPEVVATQIWCEASAAQVRWWQRWGRKLTYNRRAYEREHGPDTSIKELPPGSIKELPTGQPEGMPASELLKQMDEKAKEKVPRKPR